MPYDPFRHAADPEAAPLPDNAADVLDIAKAVSVIAYAAALDLEAIVRDVDAAAEQVVWDANGYTFGHVQHWRAVEKQAGVVQRAIADLGRLVKA